MRFQPDAGKRVLIVRFTLTISLLMTACERPQDNQAAESAEGAVPIVVTPIDSATRQILAFLRGERALDSTALADTVALYVGKEAGGTHTTYKRADLRTRANWQVRSRLGAYLFVPPQTLTKVTTKPGAHFVCREHQLASFFPDLAGHPHVGVRLEPDSMQSCLQTWNATFVFDNNERPRLIAAVYDQWEW